MNTHKCIVLLAVWCMIGHVHAQKKDRKVQRSIKQGTHLALKKIFSKKRKKTPNSEKINKDSYVLVKKRFKKVSNRHLLILTRKMNKKREQSTSYIGDKDVQITVYDLKKT